MKKIILLFLLLLGFSTLQAQKTEVSAPGISLMSEAVPLQKSTLGSAIIAAKKTGATAPAGITVNKPVHLNQGGATNAPKGAKRTTRSTSDVVRSYVASNGGATLIPSGSLILNYTQDGYGIDVGPLMASIGGAVTSDSGSGNLATLLPSQPWDLAILQINNSTLSGAEVTAITNYIAGGGKLILSYWVLASDATLRAALDISTASNFGTAIPIFTWDGAHPIMSNPNTITGLGTNVTVGFGVTGQRMEPSAGALALAGFVGAPAPNEAAIILGSSQNTITHGFMADNWDPVAFLELIENEAEFLLPSGCSSLVDQASNFPTPPANAYSSFDDGGSIVRSLMDDFNVPAGQDQNLEEVTFVLTRNATPYVTPPSIQVQIRANAGGTPGAILDTQVISGANLVDNGAVGVAFGREFHELTLTLNTPVSLTNATTYWVEMKVGATDNYFVERQNSAVVSGAPTWVNYSDLGGLQPGANIFGENRDLVFSLCTTASLGLPPVISCPMDITVSNDPGICGANVSYANAIALDPEDGQIPTVQTIPDPNVLGSGDEFPLGDTEVTFSATDSDGNTSTCTFTITVEDNEDPVIACQDITVELDAAGNYSLTPGEVLGSSSDNCGIDSVTFLVTPDPIGDCATDNPQPFGGANGTPVSVSSVIAIADSGIIGVDYNIDNVTLDITHSFDADVDIRLQSPAGTILDLSTGNGGAGANYSGTTFQDGAPNVTTGSAPFAGTYSPEGGSFAGTYGGQDINGNWTLLVSDNFPPVDDGVLNDFCINFVPQSVAQNTIDLTCANIGENDVTVVVTDDAGNSSSCMAVVTVLDVTAPEIVCIGEPGIAVDSTSDSPGLAIVDNTTVSATMTVTDDFVITDLDVDLDITHTWVGDLQITLESPAGTQVLIFDGSADGCSGDNIVDRYDDESANALDCQAGTPDAFPLADYIPSNALSAFDGENTVGDWIISIQDTAGGDQGTLNSWALNYSHDVVASPLVVELDANGNATIDASVLLMSVTEACDYVVTVGNPAPFINECGDNLPAPIDENLPPTESTATIAESGIVGDDYTIQSVSLDITHTFDGDLDIELISPSGTVLMLSDQNGGGGDNYTGTVFQDGGASIVAGTPPFTGVFEPQGGTFAATYGGEDIAGGWVLRVTDNFGGDVGTLDSFCINFAPIVSTEVDFDCSNLGLNEIEVTVTDSSGNSASCTATVEVLDVTDPILICQDVTIVLDENGMAEINPEDLLAQLPPSYEAMVIGSDNQSGTAGTTDFTVDVTDAAAISFDWIYTSNDPDPGFDSFGYLLNGVYTQLTDPGQGNQNGTANVNVNPGDVFGFRAQTDDNIFGNTETVVTNFVPGFTGQFDPANWVLNNTNSDGDAYFVEIPGGPASYDACGITVLATDITDVTCADIGTPITVTVFASDASGNLASCTAIVTVVDETGPVIENCPEDQTVDPGPLNLFYELPDYWTTGTTATDNCTDPVTILSQDPAAGTLLPDGVYTITMIAEDEYGNIGTCSFELTIESILGIENNQLENGVVIYPNPAQGVMNIANATSIQLESAAIYDMNGRLVQNINLSDMVTEKAVDVSNLASGVYMVQIIGEGGQTVKRLVKE